MANMKNMTIEQVPSGHKRRRLVEVDALRGAAALSVMLFHYTTHFTELYRPEQDVTVFFPDGNYGVRLFFVISGFVIFMSLEKTTKSMDFVVSRFSRLFPTYWAAICITFVVTHLLGLPGRLVGIGTAFGNVPMLHGFLGVHHVDSVYWTLEVELLFYCGMLLLYLVRGLSKIHFVLLVLLGIRLIYVVTDHPFGVELSGFIFRLTILRYIPWFALGISIYLVTNRHSTGAWRWPAITATSAIATLFVTESPFIATLGVGFAVLVFLAARGTLAVLRHRVLVWLGAISYPLYLLHQNIGYSVQLQLRAAGFSADTSVLLAIGGSLILATALSLAIERPVMAWIRAVYKRQAKTV